MAIRKPAPAPTPPLGPSFDEWLRTPRDELTVDDWFAMPDDGRQYELFEGKLVLMAAPGKLHQDILLKMAVAFSRHVDEHGGYVAIAPLGVGLGQQYGFEPDVVYVAPGREGILTTRGVEGVPDVVVEVLSPGTRTYDRCAKLRTYMEHGLREVWLVDADRRTVTVHRPAAPEATVAVGDPVPSGVINVGDAGLAAFRA
jgi:Uma2 family endonuclease